MKFDERYDRFLTACQDISRRRDRLAKPVIDEQVLTEVHAGVANDALLSHIIAESLLRRIDRNLVESKNIYLQRFEISQIDLFYLTCRAYPQVSQGHAIANQFLAHELRRHASATLLEIGIGKGVQIASLLRSLKDDPGRLQSLDIVAMDPSVQNIADATATIDALAPTLGFAVRVHPCNKLVEACSAADFQGIAALTADNLVINSAYSLHHTVHAVRDVERRTEILRRLAALQPRLFTLVEPSSDHDTEQLTRRFHSCWAHFGTVFDLIDESDIDPAERFAIKEKFFGREIRDIFGTSDAFRCERHEPYESWLLRLTKAGFRPYESIALDVRLPAHSYSGVSDGLVRLGYRDHPLIAVFAYHAHKNNASGGA